VVAALRRREAGQPRHLPVVALTARSMAGDRERCLAAGMDDYVSKPIRRQELFAALERALAASPSEAPGPAATGDGLLDTETLLAACDADEALLSRMIAVFRDNAPAQMQRVAAALDERSGTALREAAHKLRGLLSPFSTAAAGVAAELEQAGAAGGLDGAAGACSALAGMVAELAASLPGLSVARLRR
jgi:hypothetical protein